MFSVCQRSQGVMISHTHTFTYVHVNTHTETQQDNTMQKKFYNWQCFSGQEIVSSRMTKDSELIRRK